jgi:hypothetical protein
MANKDNLIKLVAQKLGPDNLKQMVDQAVQALGNDPDVTPEVISQITVKCLNHQAVSRMQVTKNIGRKPGRVICLNC